MRVLKCLIVCHFLQRLCVFISITLRVDTKAIKRKDIFCTSFPKDTFRFIQIALVQGGIAECGNTELPAIYIRLDDPEIHVFLLAAINSDFEGTYIFFSCLNL